MDSYSAKRQTGRVTYLGISFFYLLLYYLGCASGSGPPITLSADTPCYLTIGKELLTQQFWTEGGGNFTQDKCIAIRTPMFPMVLALAESIPGGMERWLPILYALIGLGAVLFVMRLSAGIFRESLAGLSGCWALFIPQLALEEPYCRIALTEWLLSCCMLVNASAVLCVFFRFKSHYLWTIGVTGVLSCLTRPDTIPYVAIQFLLLPLLIQKNARRDALYILMAGAIPLVLWCMVNAYRFDRFSPSLLAGHNLLGTTSFVYPSLPSSWSDERRGPSERLLLSRTIVEVAEFSPSHYSSQRLANALFTNQHTFYQVAESERWTWEFYDGIALKIALTLILQDPSLYLRYILGGVFAFEFPFYLYLPLFLNVLVLIGLSNITTIRLPIQKAFAIILVGHFVHLLALASFSVLFPRYRCATFSAFYLIFALSVVVLANSRDATWARDK